MSKFCCRESESQFILVENNYDVFLGRNETQVRYSTCSNDLNGFLRNIGDRMYQEYVKEKCFCEDVNCELYKDIKNSDNQISNFLDNDDSGIVSWNKKSCCENKTCDCYDTSSDTEYDECYSDTCSSINKNKNSESNDETIISVYNYSKKVAKHFFTFSMFLFLPVIIEVELFLNRN